MAVEENTPLKIAFVLNNKQEQVLKELLAMPENAGKTKDEACRVLVINSLINLKQQLVAKELGV